jgi:hypothetical protein
MCLDSKDWTSKSVFLCRSVEVFFNLLPKQEIFQKLFSRDIMIGKGFEDCLSDRLNPFAVNMLLIVCHVGHSKRRNLTWL